jgi:hypothetical protein
VSLTVKEDWIMEGELIVPLEPEQGPVDGPGDTPQDGPFGADATGQSPPEDASHHGHQQRDPRDGARHERRANGRGRTQRAPHHIPSRLAIAATLARIPQLVAAGMISPAQANAMVTPLRVLLTALPDASPCQKSSMDTNSLRDIFREQPDLLHALAPLFSDEQLQELVDDPADDDPMSGAPDLS